MSIINPELLNTTLSKYPNDKIVIQELAASVVEVLDGSPLGEHRTIPESVGSLITRLKEDANSKLKACSVSMVAIWQEQDPHVTLEIQTKFYPKTTVRLKLGVASWANSEYN